jgi:hypothetical protein
MRLFCRLVHYQAQACNFFEDSSSSDAADIEDLLFDDDVENMIVILTVRELEDRRKKK